MRAAWWTLGACGLVATLALPAEVRADTRFGRDTYRFGYERGYSEGAGDGYKDGRKGHRFEYWDHGDYRDADEGYKRWMGPRSFYASGFRGGYEQGYRQSFARGRAECRDRRYDADDRYRYDRYRYSDRDLDGRHREDGDDVIHEEPPYQR